MCTILFVECRAPHVTSSSKKAQITNTYHCLRSFCATHYYELALTPWTRPSLNWGTASVWKNVFTAKWWKVTVSKINKIKYSVVSQVCCRSPLSFTIFCSQFFLRLDAAFFHPGAAVLGL